MSQLIRTGLDIAPVITHRFPAGAYQQAFEVVRAGQCGKVLLEWAA
jgi:threonine 3-dehydrogenase